MPRETLNDELIAPELERAARGEEAESVPILPITEMSITRMARQKKEIREQVTGAIKEIESLRRRQDDIEKERRELEDLAQKQDLYEGGKREMVEKLSRAMLLAEKEEAQAARRVELLSVMRGRFAATLQELREIDESKWLDANYEAELAKALVMIEAARTTYRKAMSRLDAESWSAAGEKAPPSPLLREAVAEVRPVHGFRYWLVVGCALALPFAALLGLAVALYLTLPRMF
jgi:hypothetical protein